MDIDLKYTLKKTVELLAIPSPVGYTHNAIEWVRKELESLGVKKYNITKKGALIAYVKGKDSDYKKMISAHVDTLGAVVKKVKKNGRLEVTNVGGFAWGSVEGEHVTIHTLSEKTYTGTILPVKASVHVYGDVAREMPRTEETMEIRIDEDVKTDQDVFKLGILQGDFVSLDPRTRVLENGYIKSRYLDDKLCVAQNTIGVHNRYGSDATTAILQGFDFKYACIGPNVDATHHYERCHNDGIVETIKLLIAYL